tara:strand:+ start:713 stop:853 length:141 start_codon:yes stop_codon:yes gene_type:complete
MSETEISFILGFAFGAIVTALTLIVYFVDRIETVRAETYRSKKRGL